MPWEETDQFIRSGHRSAEDFQPDSLRTIVLSEDEGISAVIGKLKGKDIMEIQSYLFDRSKGWTLEKAKAWFSQHHEDETLREHVSAILLFKVLEKIVDKPLRIRGIAIASSQKRCALSKEAGKVRFQSLDVPLRGVGGGEKLR